MQPPRVSRRIDRLSRPRRTANQTHPTDRMHLKVIACEILAREFYHCAATSSCTVEMELLPQGLHDNADLCRKELQEKIDQAEPQKYGAVVLGYGLCSNSLEGIRAGKVPMVVPRAHDCITLLLGSKERYQQLFEQRPGTYYYSSGWIEYSERGGKRVEYPQKSGWVRQRTFQELAEKYGEDNARYLVDVMGSWEVNYTDGALIQFPFDGHLGLEEKVREICKGKGWRFSTIPGDLALIRRLLDGEWDGEDFLVLAPGEAVKATYGGNILERTRPAIRAEEGR